MKILIVEDEEHLGTALRLGLQEEGFAVVTVTSGADGLDQATRHAYDAIVLDIMLPELSGYEVLRRLRARDIWTPVLMLTAKDGEYDQIDALDLGADDYLTKPFSFRILVARLHALIRRGAPERPPVLRAGTLTLDPASHEVFRDGAEIVLTATEFNVLAYLMRRKDTVVSKAQILAGVWDENHHGPDNLVEVYIGYIRRKIDGPFGTTTIETLRGAGYRVLP